MKDDLLRINDHIELIELKPNGIEGFLSTYVLKGDKIAIIDPGPTASIDYLLDEFHKIGVKLEDVAYVAATHIHIDHAGGAGKLLRGLPNAKLLVHERGAPHMINPSRLWEGAKQALGELAEIYGEVEPVPSDRIIVSTEGMTVDLGGSVKFKVFETPGHASHAQSFFEEKTEGIFAGDAAGLYVMQYDATLPTTPPPFFFEHALKSLDRLIILRPRAVYYAHFGFTYQGEERLRGYKRQLSLWARVIAEAAKGGLSVDEIYKRIKEKDEMVRTAEDVLERLPIYKDNLILSILGYLDNLKRTGG